MITEIEQWIADHDSKDHETGTVHAGAPGTGSCVYCWTCEVYGPGDIRELTPEEVR